MGKTKIATIGEETKKPKREKKRSLKEERGVRVPGLKGGERVVAIVAEPLPEKREEKVVKKERPPKKRGKRYLAARTKIEPGKSYPLEEAVRLARETSISRFNGKLELHMVLTKTGKFKLGEKQIRTEPKAPILHTVVGKLSDKDSDLTSSIAEIIKAVGEKNIKKAVVSATMGPAVLVDIQKTNP